MAWAPDYITAADVRDYLRVTDSVDDVQFARWATAASRAIDRRCNRQFGQTATAVARTYRRPVAYDASSGLWLLEVDDIYDVTGLLIDGVALASTSAVLLPDNAVLDGRPYERIGLTTWPLTAYPGISITHTITAKFGWSAVPAQVTSAALLQCARWNFRRDAPAGVAGSPDQGSQIRLLAKLDPDVSTSLAGLGRRWSVA